MKRKINWSALTDNIVKLAQVVLVLAAIYQLYELTIQIHDSRRQQSAQFIMDFNNQLRGKDGYRVLLFDIANDDTTLFARHDTAEVDSYLVLWEVLASIDRNKLMDADEIYSAFSYDIQKTWESRAIQKYIRATRLAENDSTLYDGLEKLAAQFRQ